MKKVTPYTYIQKEISYLSELKICIMCRISKETVIRANEKTMKRGRVRYCSSPVVDGAITVSTRYRGVVYSQKVDVRKMQESYSRSFNAVRRDGKAI